MQRRGSEHAHWRVRLKRGEWITVCDRDDAFALYDAAPAGVRALLYDHPGA